MTEKESTLAIDVGGTSVRLAIVNSKGYIVARDHRATASAPLRQLLSTAVEDLVRRDPTHTRSVGAVGIGIPEYVRSGVATSTDVVDWTDDIAEIVAKPLSKFGGRNVPVCVEADVRCGALAEHSALQHPSTESLLYISWGTGISMAFTLPGGWCWEGARGEALGLGEWSIVDPSGGSANLEQAASGAGIFRRFDALFPGAAASTRDVSSLAASGDEPAIEILQSAGKLLAGAIVELVKVFDPHHIVVGGGLGSADSVARHSLHANYALANKRSGAPGISLPKHGADSGLIGAAIAASNRKKLGAQ